MKCSICKSEMHLGNICPKCSVDEKSSPRSDCIQDILYLLDAWETWEADMIKDDEVWLDGLPKFTDDVYNGFIELQEKRNAVLKRLRGDNAQK